MLLLTVNVLRAAAAAAPLPAMMLRHADNNPALASTMDPPPIGMVATSGHLPGAILVTSNTTCSVREYGAAGDGSTDDSAAFQRAFAACSAKSPGAVVFIPSGLYKVRHNLCV